MARYSVAFLVALAASLGAGLALPASILAQALVLVEPPASEVPTGLEEAERARLLARGEAELNGDPIPGDPMRLQLELALLEEQRETIDIAGITALQWIGAVVIILGGVTGAFGVLIGAIVLVGGGTTDAMAIMGGSGLGTIALGLTMLGLAEIDGNLHRRRQIDGRIRRLRRAERTGLYGGLGGLRIVF